MDTVNEIDSGRPLIYMSLIYSSDPAFGNGIWPAHAIIVSGYSNTSQMYRIIDSYVSYPEYYDVSVLTSPVLPSQPYQLLSCLYNIEEER